MKKFIKRNSNIIIVVIFVFLLFIFIDTIINNSIFDSSPWNSYELQTRAWLKGKLFLDHDYPWLELAIYKGNYYVSFPPFPSVFLLPFVILFKELPGNLIVFGIFASEIVLIYKILNRYNNTEFTSIMLSLGFTVGTNLLSLSINSGVWFFAQVLNNFLCILAIDAFLKEKKGLVYFFLSLAVGCRPFSFIYIIMFLIYYIKNNRSKTFYQRIINNIPPLMPAMIVAIIYMTYNYFRFDNPLEFGHSYLPEFLRASNGQFSIHYLLPNLKQIFFSKIHISKNLNLKFDEPFCFILANPVIIMFLYRSIKNIVVTKKINFFKLMIFISVLINILCVCLHRTLGGWQFGARYTCDILPFIFLSIIVDKKNGTIIKLNKFEISCLIFGILLNVFGAIIMYKSFI